jgi:hypothetical protein
MHRLKYIFRNINLLNIMLIASVIILANYIILPVFNMSITYTPPSGKKIISDKDEKPAESHIPSPSDYMIIAEENLFHPERKIPPEKKEEQSLSKPEFVLYGTLIADDLSLAYVEDLKAPRSTPGRGKRQTAMKEGDILSGFTLKEIEAEKIVMVRGEERIIVPINDPSHPKDRKGAGITAFTSQQTQKQVPQASHKKEGKKEGKTSFKPATRQKRSTEKAPRERSTPTPASTDSMKDSVKESPLKPDIKSFTGPGQQYTPSGKGGALLFPNR